MLKKKMKQRGSKAKPYEMMFWTNFFMFLVALTGALLTGDLFPGAKFIADNPDIMSAVALFAACSAAGQSFIFFVIATFGALKCATLTTTRKIFSVLYSIFTRGHKVAPVGWLGIVIGSLGIIGELIPQANLDSVPTTPAGGPALIRGWTGGWTTPAGRRGAPLIPVEPEQTAAGAAEAGQPRTEMKDRSFTEPGTEEKKS